jgi:hypothetical protein
MRKLVVVLSITIVALTGVAAWQARELRDARRQLAAREQATASPSSRPVPASAVPAKPVSNADVEADSKRAPSAPAADDRRAQLRAALEQELPQLRDILENPDKRASYLRVMSANHHRAFPRLAGYLGLTDDESDRLADLLAEQQLRVMEVRYRCALNPACDQFGFGSGYRQAADQELIDLLGPERKKRFDDYRDNTQERNQVTRMRGEMPDALRFNDDQAEKLATALGEERRRTVTEWEQNGTAYAGLTTEFGSIYYPESPQDVELRLADAREYLERQRKQAAGVLNAKQLEYFGSRQQLFLEQLREHLQSEANAGKPGSR